MTARGGELANGPIATECNRFSPHRRCSIGKRALVGLGSIDRDVQNSTAAGAATAAPIEARPLIVTPRARDGATMFVHPDPPLPETPRSDVRPVFRLSTPPATLTRNLTV